MSFFGTAAGAPRFTWVPLPLKVGKVVKTVLHPIMMPHDWLQSLHAHRPDLFRDSVLGTEENGRLNFWESMKDTDIVTKHPHLERKDWSRTVPLGLHGDGGSYFKHESMFVFTFK